MNRDLFTVSEFNIITFPTTQTALQAEKVLEMADEPFILIPTPQEVSAGCGLAVKCTKERKSFILEILTRNQVQYSAVHLIKRGH